MPADSLAHRLELGGAATAGGKNRQANFEDCPDAPPSLREGDEESEGEGERGEAAGGGDQRGGTRYPASALHVTIKPSVPLSF